MLEDRLLEDMIECWHARLDAIGELSPGPPGDVMGGEARESGEALRVVASKQLSHRSQSELAISTFSKQPDARESPQQSIEGILGYSGIQRNTAALPRPLCQFVSQ